MKRGVGILFLLISTFAYGQVKSKNFLQVDWKVQSVDAPTPDSLAKKLTAEFTTEADKVRAIFRWIAENIAYKVVPRYTARYHYIKNWDDTSMEWAAGDAMMAWMVMQKRTAFCEGYAALFKALCNYAGIEARVVKGFARVNSHSFYTNHSWNAVRIDSNWYLLDVTWASGYVITPKDEFVKHFDERYFLTPPDQLIRTHYPEDIRWALLPNVPDIREFNRSPYKYSNYIKYSIASYFPSKGKIETTIGDTLRFELAVSNRERDKRIGSDPFFDSTVFATPYAAFIEPNMIEDRKVSYQFVVDSADTEWLHLIYNNDIVLRYRLHVRTNKDTVSSYNHGQ